MQVAHQLAKEVVEHGGEAVNKGWVTEDGLDVGGQLLQCVDGVVGHDIVVACHHAQLPQQPLLLLTLLWGQVIPRPRLFLLLLRLDLTHVLKPGGQATGICTRTKKLQLSWKSD